MTNNPDLRQLLQPILADVVNQVVTSSSGTLPPTQQTLNQHVVEATETIIAALADHLDTSHAHPSEPPLTTDAIVFRGLE